MSKKTGHMDGKRCGYDVLPDGSIRIAPMYSSQFDNIFDQRVAAQTVLANVTKQCAELERLSAKAIRELWHEVMDDYGLTVKNGGYEYIGDGIIRPLPKKEKESE